MREWNRPELEAVLRLYGNEAEALSPGVALQRLLARIADADTETLAACADAFTRTAHPHIALDLLRDFVIRHPQSAALRASLGNALRMNGDAAGAERELRHALALAPAHRDAALSLAFLLREQGRLDAAAEAILALWRHAPRTRDHDLATLGFLVECQRYAAAEPVAAAAVAAHPDDAAIAASAGEIALALGDFAAAQVRLRRAVDRDATQAGAWLRLAHSHRIESADDEDFQRIERTANGTIASPDAVTAVGFALAKCYDELGRHDAAASAWRAANALQLLRTRFDAAEHRRRVDAAIAAAPLPALAPRREITPVFVVGLPRSGTTLVASLLGRHAQVRNRGELNWIGAFAQRLGPAPTRSQLQQVADVYLAQLRQDDAPAVAYVDKNPLNFLQLGLIAALVPNAKIVHCRRGRRDTAFSIWTQHFAHPDMAWAYDFADIASFAAAYDRLLPHWQKSLPLDFLDVDYESLVADPDATAATLYDFVGVSGDATHARNDAVTTASVWQARQEVYASSVGRWQAYAQRVPELAALFAA